MPDFAALIPETYQNVSPGYVDTLIQERRAQLFTGLMRLVHPSSRQLVLGFLDGVQQKLYRCSEDSIDVMPRHAWPGVLDHANSSLGFLSLSAEALRFARVVYEAPVCRVERESFQLKELNSAVTKWVLEGDPVIVHVKNDALNRYYLMAGHSTPIVEELAFVNGMACFSLNDASFAHSLPESVYQVTRFVSNGGHEVWREYELRLAFNPLVRLLLGRFGELAGRVLTERLCQQLSLWVHENGWHISLTSNGAVNRQYFESLASAVTAYSEVLRRFGEEAGSAIGHRMVDGIVRDSLARLDPYRREILTRHLYSQQGVTWR